MAPPLSSPLDAPALLDRSYVVAEAGDVGATPLAVRVLGTDFVVWRDRSGRPVAAADRCPHREAPLSAGAVVDGCLVCPYHGWTFGEAGRCVAVPSSGPDAPVPPAAHLATVAVAERYGLVWLCPGGSEVDPPTIPQDADPAFRRLNSGVETWAASATRMTDNFCDVAHFPWVHRDTLGADVDPVVGPVVVESLDDDFVGYRYTVAVDNASGHRVEQEMTTGYHLPFVVRSTTRFLGGPDAGSERVLLLCATPIDDTGSLFTFVVWRNGTDALSDAEQIAFDRRVGAEDRTMLERIGGHLPLDPVATANVRADRLSVDWRRRLAALLTP